MLDSIIIMDETWYVITLKKQKRSKPHIANGGQPGPLKPVVHTSRTKQMVMVFLDSRGLI
jgi:hypothetical protein